MTDVLLAHIKRGELNYKFTLHFISTTSIWIEVISDDEGLIWRKLQHLNPDGLAWKDDPFGVIKSLVPEDIQSEADKLILKAMKLKALW